MRTREILWALACASALGGCGRGEIPASREPARVRHFGALHAIVHEGRTEPRVSLDGVVPGPHAFAVGALSELRGEVTVIDDVVWLAYPGEGGSARVERAPRSDERATLLVAANVVRWRSMRIERAVRFVELDDTVESIARAQGVDTAEPFPFRIEGPVDSIAWHVVDGRRLTPGGGHASHLEAAIRDQRRGAHASIVGFYSREHEGVFTHMGERTHMHVVLEEPAASGHVDHVDLASGATLWLPE